MDEETFYDFLFVEKEVGVVDEEPNIDFSEDDMFDNLSIKDYIPVKDDDNCTDELFDMLDNEEINSFEEIKN